MMNIILVHGRRLAERRDEVMEAKGIERRLKAER